MRSGARATRREDLGRDLPGSSLVPDVAVCCHEQTTDLTSYPKGLTGTVRHASSRSTAGVRRGCWYAACASTGGALKCEAARTPGAEAGNEAKEQIERENDRSRRPVLDAVVAITSWAYPDRQTARFIRFQGEGWG